MFKIQTLFIITAFLISVINFIFLKSTIDIQFYDTYYIISQKLLAQFLAVVYILNFVIYFGFAYFNKPLQKHLGSIHYILTVFPALVLLFKLTHDIGALTLLVMIAIVLFVSGQIILLVNIFRSLKISNT